MPKLLEYFKNIKIYKIYKEKEKQINYASHAPQWVAFAGIIVYPAIVFALLPVMDYEHNTNHIMIYINKVVFYLIIFNMIVLFRISDFIRPKRKDDSPLCYYISVTLDSICLFGYGAGLPAMFLMLVLQ